MNDPVSMDIGIRLLNHPKSTQLCYTTKSPGGELWNNEKSPKQPIFVGCNCLGQQRVEAPL